MIILVFNFFKKELLHNCFSIRNCILLTTLFLLVERTPEDEIDNNTSFQFCN